MMQALADLPNRLRRWRRALPWITLVLLLLIAQTLLVWMTIGYEGNRAQEQVEAAAAGAVTDLKQAMLRDQQSLQALMFNDPSELRWSEDAAALLRQRRELRRIERRDLAMRLHQEADSPFDGPIDPQFRRTDADFPAQIACVAAQRQLTPTLSGSYFIPLPGGMGHELMDLCMPVLKNGQLIGYLVGSFSLAVLLDTVVVPEVLRTHELSFVDGDGSRLARAGLVNGSGVYRAQRLVELPGQVVLLRVDSIVGEPQLIPNLTLALVLGLSLGLGGVVMMLARDGRKRADIEAALAETLSLRKAMEDSLVTGLRARDLQGRVTYVNPAFCEMVGYSATELIGQSRPPYWPPERAEQYARAQRDRIGTPPSREGHESLYMRRNGERLSVLVFEAKLVDGHGRHTGWMSSILDVTGQRKVEELSRQQQERLQATARLATVGEMASLLSHELNQPLAAIASYAAGSLNLMQDAAANDPAETQALLHQATQRIAEQAERAGRVIKSVHDFVRRRAQAHEPIRADQLIESVMPLVRLQARKSAARITIEVPQPAPRVVCDRTMLEQVILNLTRNGIQSMEGHTPAEQRELLIRVRQTDPRWVSFGVIDRGTGVAPDVAQRLFTPFFTTRAEGMGLGLSLCRTVIEQHGGGLDFVNVLAPDDVTIIGAEFRFTLPAADAPPATAASSTPTPRALEAETRS
jgi:two-component system sensor histidine kinase DctS